MSNHVRLILVLHNHQPVGNFDYVFEQAYTDSYRPFLEVFARYRSLKMSLHVSGPLMEWLQAHHPEYIVRLAEMVARGRLEIIGGAFYEPILAMLSARDITGQIRSYTRWLENHLGATVRGIWVPERVWEPAFTRQLVDAGIQYTVLDDFHFKNAGLTDSQLAGRYLTEDDGRVLSIFPGSEQLRYLIPFGSPQETIDYLGQIAQQHSDPVVVFGDDGEKFGTWPGTHEHVYNDRWLERFFDALVENQDWIQVTTLAEAAESVEPVGKVYLPESSYREMTEWALPAEQLAEYEKLAEDMRDDPRWCDLQRFIRGGFWRNFKVKYPEANEMYARMMAVSRRLQRALQTAARDKQDDAGLLERARTELYRAQCNCGYWHGAFGGIYLPHLRNAIYAHAIAADNLLDEATRTAETWIEALVEDLDFDARPEIQLANDKLIALISPGRGGRLYELDVRAPAHNLLATMTRRPEAYHRKILAEDHTNHDHCASIHDRVTSKQEGLDRKLQYDDYPRKSLLDLFYDEKATLESVASGKAAQGGDFLSGRYQARVRRNPDRIQVQLTRAGNAWGVPLRITKGLTLDAGSSTLEIAYMLEDLPPDRPLHFAVEFNFAGLPADSDDRYFYGPDHSRLGHLGTRLDLVDVDGLGLIDRWLGIELRLSSSRPTHFWTYPIQTVSQSEGGFELVHQSVVVQPHWIVTPDAKGRWIVTIDLAIDTVEAGGEHRLPDPAVAAATS